MSDDSRVKNKTSLLKSHQLEQAKQHIVYDAQARPQFIFTADINCAAGDPCLVTEYVYRNATSTDIICRQERIYAWKASWDSLFVFDPTADYDPDGDGNL
jgi:hypothetical protein